ncbi:MAG TPA: hypothetical protein VMJ93_00325 [Verrucomicrobiae bacterium]|nr:hypothetical protein [Verrucomicrobiae bacterium]
MPRWLQAFVLAASFASAASLPASAQTPPRTTSPSSTAPQTGDAPLSPAEIRSRAKILIANQHADDRAIQEYECVQNQMARTGGMNPRVLEDKVFRVVPTGFGPYKILLKQDGKDVDKEDYRRQLERWEDALKISLDPSDPRAQDPRTKFEKKSRDRSDLVDAMEGAFIPHWVGREMRNGYLCDVVQLDPNPQYHARNMFQDALSHVIVKLWVDHASNQLVHGEATVTHDISFGGGIFGKLYRGGVFSMDQREFAPGVWLPIRWQYDYTARKFLFTSEEHELVEAGQYQRLGSPKQALAVVEAELAKSEPAHGDP